MLALLALLALAGPNAAPGDATAVRSEASFAVLVRTATDRMARGDHDGAELLLQQAIRQYPARWVEPTYQRANNLALQRRYAQARDVYARIAGQAPDSHRGDDARFRVAELTGVLGDPEGAIDRLRDLRPWRRFDAADEAKIRLNYGWFTVQREQPRRARRRLRRALRKAEPGTVPYYEAKAWAGRVRLHIDSVEDRVFEGSRRRIKKQLLERERAVLAGEDALRRIIDLEEPEWILDSILVLSAAYEDLGDDMLAADEPDDLTEAQRDLYRQGLQKQIDPLYQRAEAYLIEGAALAGRLGWSSTRVADIEAERARLTRKLRERPLP